MWVYSGAPFGMFSRVRAIYKRRTIWQSLLRYKLLVLRISKPFIFFLFIRLTLPQYELQPSLPQESPLWQGQGQGHEGLP